MIIMAMGVDFALCLSAALANNEGAIARLRFTVLEFSGLGTASGGPLVLAGSPIGALGLLQDGCPAEENSLGMVRARSNTNSTFEVSK